MSPMNPYGFNPYYSNPMMTAQQRLVEMEQQYPQFAQQNQQNMNPMQQNIMSPSMQGVNQNFVKCRAVTSIDEAKASMIDLDGSIHVFTDIGNRKIYTKQINLDGTATLNTYVLQETPEPAQAQNSSAISIDPDDFVKRDEIESILQGFNQQIADLQDQVRGYERAFAMLQEDKAKAQSNKTGGKK